jgi:hypothetical protein
MSTVNVFGCCAQVVVDTQFVELIDQAIGHVSAAMKQVRYDISPTTWEPEFPDLNWGALGRSHTPPMVKELGEATGVISIAVGTNYYVDPPEIFFAGSDGASQFLPAKSAVD